MMSSRRGLAREWGIFISDACIVAKNTKRKRMYFKFFFILNSIYKKVYNFCFHDIINDHFWNIFHFPMVYKFGSFLVRHNSTQIKFLIKIRMYAKINRSTKIFYLSNNRGLTQRQQKRYNWSKRKVISEKLFAQSGLIPPAKLKCPKNVVFS